MNIPVGGQRPKSKGPFADMSKARKISHPPETPRPGHYFYHADVMGGEWAHTHLIPEDGPFQMKQELGEHIDTWHTPPFGEKKEEEQDAEE